MTAKTLPAKINRNGGRQIQRNGPDYSFVFSSEIEDWTGGSARRKHNIRAAKYNTDNRIAAREKDKLKKHSP
jgi:hypothetical protein